MNSQATTYQHTCQYREAYAKKLFALPRIENLITRATHLGLTHIMISQSHPMNLCSTTAAATLITHLEDLGYQTWWHEHTITLNTEGIVGTEVVYFILEINWHVIRPDVTA